MPSKAPVQIILVEDNLGDVQLLERTLKSRQIAYKITRYEDADQAIEAMAGWDALCPDLILLDLNLPRREGFDVLSRVRQRPGLVGIPIGVLTSSEAEKDRHRVALIGAERYIHKPPYWEQFAREVGDAVEDLLAQADAV